MEHEERGELLMAETLVCNFWQLLADEGIEVKNYQAVEDLPL